TSRTRCASPGVMLFGKSCIGNSFLVLTLRSVASLLLRNATSRSIIPHMADASPKPDRRTERSKQAVLDATRELLAEEGGVRALTIEAVAARSGVAKSTIYRRWRDKWELALDAAMIDMLTTFDDPVDVGDTRTELITFVNSAVRTMGAKPYGPALQGLVSEV